MAGIGSRRVKPLPVAILQSLAAIFLCLVNLAQAREGRPIAGDPERPETRRTLPAAPAVPGTAASTFLLAQQTGQDKPASAVEDVPGETQEQKPASPFEDVPEEQKPASPFEDVQEEQTPAAERGPRQDVIENVEFRGARRISRDGLLARIFSKPGDAFDEASLRRDFMVLWNTGLFDDLRLEVEQGERGKIVRFVVVERRVIRTIRYEGNKSATISDILERFKERRVGLTVESPYEPTRVQRAVLVLRELLGETRPPVRQSRTSGSSDTAIFD